MVWPGRFCPRWFNLRGRWRSPQNLWALVPAVRASQAAAPEKSYHRKVAHPVAGSAFGQQPKTGVTPRLRTDRPA